MKDNKFSEDLKRQMSTIDSTAEELSVKLNDLIAKHQLDAQAVMATLARLFASIISSLQRDMPTQNSKDVVEKIYLRMLDSYLTVHGMQDLVTELEKMDKEMENLENSTIVVKVTDSLVN